MRIGQLGSSPNDRIALRMAGLSSIRKALFSMPIEIVNTIVGILFVGIWLIVGHIITINHS
jgi:uncharacterized membrane protein YccF (DUF307 family)